jgi:hypothetical protein
MPNQLVDNELFTDFDDVSSKYDSNGRHLTNSQAAFFAKSDCLDETGRLLVVYHASPNDFTDFDPARIGTGGGSIYGKGFYFCDSDFGLDMYGKYIKEFYLNLTNPFRWEAIEEDADAYYNIDMFIEVLKSNNFDVTDSLRRQLEQDVLENDGGLDTIIEQTCGVDFAQKYFINAGYDGIMNISIGDYVAFDPKQIKLCSNRAPSETANAAA